MPSRKILLLRGLGELEKLETTGHAQTFKYVVEKCRTQLGPRRPIVFQIKDDEAPTVIVKATTHFVAVCTLQGEDKVPAHLPRVNWAYL